LASATSAEKKQGSRAPRGPKVSNNFGSAPACRNPARVAKIDGGVAEAEAAGGSPRKQPHGLLPQKKPHGEETFLICLDRAKVTAEHGRTEPIELEGDPDDRADGGRPKKGLPKMTKAPPVTQEEDGVDNLDSDEEEVDSEDDEVSDLDDDDEELDTARTEATRESIPVRPRRATRPRRAKCYGGANDQTDGGRPENSLPKTTGDLDDDKELNDEGIKDDEGLKDKGKTAPVVWEEPPPSVDGIVWLNGGVLVRPPVEKPRGKPDRAEALPIFYREQPRVGISRGEPDKA
jgi:hypothetical protein